MLFIKTFKGYEDKTGQLDENANRWIVQHNVDVVDIKAVLGHEPNSRSGSGDLIYTIMYKANEPVL